MIKRKILEYYIFIFLRKLFKDDRVYLMSLSKNQLTYVKKYNKEMIKHQLFFWS